MMTIDLKSELSNTNSFGLVFDLENHELHADCINHCNQEVIKAIKDQDWSLLPLRFTDDQSREWKISYNQAENEIHCDLIHDQYVRSSVMEHLAYYLEYGPEANISESEETEVEEYLIKNNLGYPVLTYLIGFDTCEILGVLGNCRVVIFTRLK